MQSPTKPKLGNAATLFNNSGEVSPLYKKQGSKKTTWAFLTAGFGIAGLLTAMFLMQHDPIQAKQLSVSDSVTKDDSVDLVQANYKKDQLVGTLVRADDAPTTPSFASSKPTKLTEQERARLLDIISRQ